jgi:putative pyoverdin transport system ATP-binding/permease protein
MVEILKVLAFLLRTSREVKLARLAAYAAIATGLLSGVGYTALLALVNSGLAAPSNRRLALAFVALCVVVPASRLTSQALFNLIGARAVFAVRLRLCHRILATPLRRLEELGAHRLLACLTDDVTALTSALALVPALSMHVAVVCACLAYMGWLSGRLLLLVLAAMLAGMTTYTLPLDRARRYLTRLRQETDALFRHFRALVHGAKELQLHEGRRQAFLDSALTPTSQAIRSYTFLGNTVLTLSAVWGNLVFFIVIGILVFTRPFGAETRTLSGFILALLYMLTPLEVIFQSLPVLARAAASAAQLERLGIELGSRAEEAPVALPAAPPAWRTLRLASVTHAYRSEDGRAGFTLGPIDLTFRSGELVFLIGGNGSGKTSLAKLLVGLYQPESGEILLDGRPVGEADRERYRQMFSAVFADFYLFEDLSGLARERPEEEARRYLKRLELDRKVEVKDGALSTLDLSQGQRKRLALLSAYLEDRPIYFFDEWAADQDPQFKAIFYFEILAELKARGKTVFVISHDDAYYEVADRLIKLNYGQVEWDRPGARAAAEEALPAGERISTPSAAPAP